MIWKNQWNHLVKMWISSKEFCKISTSMVIVFNWRRPNLIMKFWNLISLWSVRVVAMCRHGEMLDMINLAHIRKDWLRLKMFMHKLRKPRVFWLLVVAVLELKAQDILHRIMERIRRLEYAKEEVNYWRKLKEVMKKL